MIGWGTWTRPAFSHPGAHYQPGSEEPGAAWDDLKKMWLPWAGEN